MKQVLVTLGALACLACSPGDHDESRSSALATEPRIPPAPRVPGEPPPSVVDPSPSSFVVTGEILRQEEQRDRDRVAATTDVRAWLSRIRKTTELAVVATPIGAERVGPDNVHMQDFVVETSLFGSQSRD